ncbi:hypothetical protein EMGBS3_13920, partial [Anaerolineaceae bacterium]
RACLGFAAAVGCDCECMDGRTVFHRGERGNISIQFLPFFLILVFPAYELLLAELPVLNGY